MRFTSKLSMGEIRHQDIQALLAAAIRPFAGLLTFMYHYDKKPHHMQRTGWGREVLALITMSKFCFL